MSHADIARMCSDREISYEMLCRGIKPTSYTCRSKVIWWTAQLKKEADSDTPIISTSPIPSSSELKECKEIYKELFNDVTSDSMDELERVSVRLNFLKVRLQRIEITADDETVPILLNEKSSLETKVEVLEGKVCERRHVIWKGLDLSNTSNSLPLKQNVIDSPDNEVLYDHIDVNNTSIISIPENREENNKYGTISQNRPALYKWGIHFSGDNPKESASEFLQRVADFAQSRDVTGSELLQSFSDLLEGSALKWFRTKRSTFGNYREFVDTFLHHFEPRHSEDLLEIIRSRKQKGNESIIQFIANMEDLFMRLRHFPSEKFRLKIIRNNLLPHFIRAISLLHFDFVDQLTEACRKVEDSESQALRNITYNYRRLDLKEQYGNTNRENRFDNSKSKWLQQNVNAHKNNYQSNPNRNQHSSNYKSQNNDRNFYNYHPQRYVHYDSQTFPPKGNPLNNFNSRFVPNQRMPQVANSDRNNNITNQQNNTNFQQGYITDSRKNGNPNRPENY